MDVECAKDLEELLGGVEGISDQRRAVVRKRFFKVLDTAERGADRAEAWDTSMFLMGFAGSLVVTIATAINLAGYVTPSMSNGVSTVILLLSSLGTAAMGLRERLKFKEQAVLSRRTSSLLQQAAILYLAQAGPYGGPLAADPDAAYRLFVQQVERIKHAADVNQLQLRESEDNGGSGSGATSTATPGSGSASASTPTTGTPPLGAGVATAI